MKPFSMYDLFLIKIINFSLRKSNQIWFVGSHKNKYINTHFGGAKSKLSSGKS